MDHLRLDGVLRNEIPVAADASCLTGEEVLVWRENQISNCVEKWMSPYEVARIDDSIKLEYIRIEELDPRPFN